MDHEKLAVAFRLNGGIGTYIAELNFIQYFYDKFSELLEITIYGSSSSDVNHGLMGHQYFISHYFARQEYMTQGFDLVIEINWFPKVTSANWEKIRALAPNIEDTIKTWMFFANDRRTKDYLHMNAMFDPNIYNYAIVNAKNRLNVMDIGGILGIGKTMKFQLNTEKNEQGLLSRFGLFNKQYITLQQGVNANSLSMRSPKQWPVEYYNDLCLLLKNSYPEFSLIQLGESSNNLVIDNVDMCLLGQTNFEELKVILKNAYLHIDGECGMVHIRKALHTGPSVVLYGQTPHEVHGYDDDINVYTNVCKHWCCKMFASWKRKCYMGDAPICMTSLTPQIVFEKIKEYYSTGITLPTENISKLYQLLCESAIKLDPEWVENWLNKRKIDAYWFEKRRLKELIAAKLTPDGYIKVPLSEMPAFQFFKGDRQAYSDYMVLNDQFNPGHEHSIERIESLVNSFQTSGFQTERCIAVDGENKILDGVHRACWLLNELGEDAQVTVLKLYGDWNI